jgi:hypothetical protein
MYYAYCCRLWWLGFEKAGHSESSLDLPAASSLRSVGFVELRLPRGCNQCLLLCPVVIRIFCLVLYVSSIVQKDEKDGETYLKIPVLISEFFNAGPVGAVMWAGNTL